jgi:hypothetical protein
MEMRKSPSDPADDGDAAVELEQPEAAQADLGAAIARDAAAVRDAVEAGTVPPNSGVKLSHLLDTLAAELGRVAPPPASSPESASDIDAHPGDE